MPQATEYHLGQLKAKLAKLRTELQAPAAVSVHGVAMPVLLWKMSLHLAHPDPFKCFVSRPSGCSTGCAYVQQTELRLLLG